MKEQWEIDKGRYGKDFVEFNLHGVLVRLPCNTSSVDQNTKPRLLLEITKCPPSTPTSPTNT